VKAEPTSEHLSVRVTLRLKKALLHIWETDPKPYRSLSDFVADLLEQIARKRSPQHFVEESGLQSPHALGSGPAPGPEPMRRPRPGRFSSPNRTGSSRHPAVAAGWGAWVRPWLPSFALHKAGVGFC